MPLLDSEGSCGVECDRCHKRERTILAAWRDGWSIRYEPALPTSQEVAGKRRVKPSEIFLCSKCTAEVWLLKEAK